MTQALLEFVIASPGVPAATFRAMVLPNAVPGDKIPICAFQNDSDFISTKRGRRYDRRNLPECITSSVLHCHKYDQMSSLSHGNENGGILNSTL